MTIHHLTMPCAETIQEWAVVAWLVEEGQHVHRDDPFILIASDKVEAALPSQFEGTLSKQLVCAGEVISSGDIFAIFEEHTHRTQPTAPTKDLHVLSIPAFEETDHALITEWFVSSGDPVRNGDAVGILETDKVELELAAPCDGVLLCTLVEVGETHPNGTALAIFHAHEADASPPIQPVITPRTHTLMVPSPTSGKDFTVAAWVIEEGEFVEPETLLGTLTTRDNACLQLKSPTYGTLRRTFFAVGETFPPETVYAFFDEHAPDNQTHTTHVFHAPFLGEAIQTFEISQWLVKPSDPVQKKQAICTLTLPTYAGTPHHVTLESEHAGVFVRTLAPTHRALPDRTPIAIFTTPPIPN